MLGEAARGSNITPLIPAFGVGSAAGQHRAGVACDACRAIALTARFWRVRVRAVVVDQQGRVRAGGDGKEGLPMRPADCAGEPSHRRQGALDEAAIALGVVPPHHATLLACEALAGPAVATAADRNHRYGCQRKHQECHKPQVHSSAGKTRWQAA